jgi:hypothetical protein
MPIIAPSLTGTIQDALESILDSLRKALRSLVTATDFHQLLARVKPLFDDLARLVSDFVPVDPAEAFLAPEGAVPKPEQASIDQFAQMVVDAVQSGWTPEMTATFGPIVGGVAGAVAAGGGAPTPAKQLADFLRTISPMFDAELFIRYALNIKGLADPEKVAQKVANLALDAAADSAVATDPAWGVDEPMSDETKKAEEPDKGLDEGSDIAKVLNAFLALIPGSTGPKGPQVGQAIHRALMGRYVNDHPTHLVLVDSAIRLESKLPGEKVRLSRMLSPDGDLLVGDLPLDDKLQLTAFANVMRDPATKKRIHVDIADMHERAEGVKPEDDWGWFEIKPMADIRQALEEIALYYLPRWNHEVEIKHPNWVKGPGVWQPATVSVAPSKPPVLYIYAAATIPPGVIGYLTFDATAAAQAAAVIIITTLAALFAKRLLAELLILGEEYRGAENAFAEFMLAWALLIITAFLVALAAIALIPEEAIAGAAASLIALIARIALLMPNLVPG